MHVITYPPGVHFLKSAEQKKLKCRAKKNEDTVMAAALQHA